MHLPPGTQLGPYRIEAVVGSGGMGDVYRAVDTRLDRTVALKTLRPGFRERFEREARTISQLSHPHICALHDIGTHEATDFLVMEFLDGETLDERLLKGRLPLEQALKIGAQIASALGTAHRAGIVHRDLKPANVILTKTGAKLVDFGLAKPMARTAAVDNTLTMLITGERTLVGTLQYMSPEQLAGEEADGTSDIFAVGALLYQMVTGRRAFDGASQASVIAAILQVDPPPLSTLLPVAPPELERLIDRCLRKRRDERWQNALDLATELEWIIQGPAAVVSRSRNSQRLAWWVAAALFACVIALAFVHFREPRAERHPYTFSLQAPDKSTFREVALSPNGRKVAFVANAEDKTLLWVRTLDSLAALPLPGTEGASYPFWSPNSSAIAFFAGGKLKKVDLSGGSPQALCDAPDGTGGTWAPSNVIVFAAVRGGWLSRVPAAGGESTPITTLDESRRENAHYWPQFLPDGNRFLYWVRSGSPEHTGLYMGSLDAAKISDNKRRIASLQSNAHYAVDEESQREYLLFVREGTLVAQPYDLAEGKPLGDPMPISEQVGYDAALGFGNFSLSRNGVLTFGKTGTIPQTRLMWLVRGSNATIDAGFSGAHSGIALSPDEKHVALAEFDSQGSDIWLYDIPRAVSSRLTFDPSPETSPIWARDGLRIIYRSLRDGPGNIYFRLASGVGDETGLIRSPNGKVPASVSADGRRLIYGELHPKTKWDLWSVEISYEKPGIEKPAAFLQTEFNEMQAQFSPDGKWVAYTSDQTGAKEVYVQSFPSGPNRWRVSTHGGEQPKWAGSDKELFYLAPDGKIMAVRPGAGGSFDATVPMALFATRVMPTRLGNDYDVSNDGRRFLVNLPVRDQPPAPLTVIANWQNNLTK